MYDIYCVCRNVFCLKDGHWIFLMVSVDEYCSLRPFGYCENNGVALRVVVKTRCVFTTWDFFFFVESPVRAVNLRGWPLRSAPRASRSVVRG